MKIDNPNFINTVELGHATDTTLSRTAAAGAAADVETTANVPLMATDVMGANTVAQPVALATNGTLTITPGITFSGTGSTESWQLRTYVIEELN